MMRHPAVFCILLQLIFQISSCTNLTLIPGSTIELPCLYSLTDFPGATATWKYNGEDITSDAQSNGSVRVKKGGLFLLISPVTPASQGQYMCSLKENNLELTNSYNVIVQESVIYRIHVSEGSNIHLPCYFSKAGHVKANAQWFKEFDNGTRTLLTTDDVSDSDTHKSELLYPYDHDQTIILRNTVMEDSGLYHCESADGQKLSTVYITVKVAPTDVPHSCNGFTTALEPCQDEESRTADFIMQESITEFAMKLYSYLRASNPSSNLLFSPISISGLLSHLLLGARGDTRRAIQTAVCVPHNFHCVHDEMKRLREKLANSMQIASQIYYNPYINLAESFLDQSLQLYDAEPVRLLKSIEESTQMINSWVANKTNNKITKFVESVSPNTQLMLLNAVSFSGQWIFKFDEKPRKGHFTKLNGDLISVPILFHENYQAKMAYDTTLKAQVARFALTGNSSLYIILPRSNQVSELQKLEEKMTDTAVRQMIETIKSTSPQIIEVSLPQIKMDVQPDMNILIKKLGLSSLFESPNLCGLYAEDRLVLDEARHRATLVMNEQGVEAAAATSIAMSRSFLSFQALQPFVLLVWNDAANVPLFVGRVTDP